MTAVPSAIWVSIQQDQGGRSQWVRCGAGGRGSAEQQWQAGGVRGVWECGADIQAVADWGPEVAEERREEDSKRCQGKRVRDTEAPRNCGWQNAERYHVFPPLQLSSTAVLAVQKSQDYSITAGA